MNPYHRYTHYRLLRPQGALHEKGGLTLAYMSYTVDCRRCLLTTAAVCSRGDNFCRAIGRRVASGRLTLASRGHGRWWRSWVLPDTDDREELRRHLDDVARQCYQHAPWALVRWERGALVRVA